MNAKELLLAPMAYMPPGRLLDGLSASQAASKPAPGLHSIVEILAHLIYWQDWFIQRCQGVDAPMAMHAAEGWPAAGEADWEVLRTRFLEGLERAVELDLLANQPLNPPIPFPPMAGYTIKEAITHMAVHNAHHLGQIVTLRQLMGAWPPPEGSWTW